MPSHGSRRSGLAVSDVTMLPCMERSSESASLLTELDRGSIVVSERLGLEPVALLAVLEDMGYPNRRRHPLNPGLQ